MPAPVLVVLALALWGTWGFLHKHAVDRAHPLTVEWMTATPYVVLLPMWFVLGRKFGPAMNTDAKTFAFSAGGALCGLAATVCVLFALRDRPASYVIAATSGYPMVTLLLALATGLESFNAARAAGIALIVSGVALLAITGK
jgi:drug/metabolite transporter (DMT)-like permease